MISIHFTNNKVIGGQTLDGNVNIVVTKPIDFCAVEIYFIGVECTTTLATQVVANPSAPPPRAPVNRSTTNANNMNPAANTAHSHEAAQRIVLPFKDKKEFFKHKELLLLQPGTAGYSISGERAQLAIGNYQIPFSIALPDTLLPSIKYKGPPSVHVHYFAAAKINTSRVFSDFISNVFKKEKVSFIVEGSFNANKYRTLNVPISKNTEKSFLFKSGKLHMKVDLPRSVYHIGEIIPITLIVNNETSKLIKDITVALRQDLHMKKPPSSAQAVADHQTVHLDLKKQINPTSKFDLNIEFLIPSDNQKLLKSVNEGGKTFKIHHLLIITLVPKGLAISLSLEFPITLMAIPPPPQNNNNNNQYVPSPNIDQNNIPLYPGQQPQLVHGLSNEQLIMQQQQQIIMQQQQQLQQQQQMILQQQNQMQPGGYYPPVPNQSPLYPNQTPYPPTPYS